MTKEKRKREKRVTSIVSCDPPCVRLLVKKEKHTWGFETQMPLEPQSLFLLLLAIVVVAAVNVAKPVVVVVIVADIDVEVQVILHPSHVADAHVLHHKFV